MITFLDCLKEDRFKEAFSSQTGLRLLRRCRTNAEIFSLETRQMALDILKDFESGTTWESTNDADLLLEVRC